MRVLLVEDDRDLSRVIVKALNESEFATDVAFDGEAGLARALGDNYDVIVLDVMLPGLDGFSVISQLRVQKDTPVLFLTARDATADRIEGLNLGADDYLTKPFALKELLARLRALVRRSSSKPNPVIEIGDIKLMTVSRDVYRNGELVPLTAKEYAILHLLLMKRGELVTRTAIYESVYGDQDNSLSNVVDVYIANLRKKLGATFITTRRGAGYIVRA